MRQSKYWHGEGKEQLFHRPPLYHQPSNHFSRLRSLPPNEKEQSLQHDSMAALRKGTTDPALQRGQRDLIW